MFRLLENTINKRCLNSAYKGVNIAVDVVATTSRPIRFTVRPTTLHNMPNVKANGRSITATRRTVTDIITMTIVSTTERRRLNPVR